MMGNLPSPSAVIDPAAAETEKRRRIWEALNGRSDAMPQNIGQGIAAIGDAIVDRQEFQNSMFPSAPGGGQADWATNFRNLFKPGRNGGLY